jgi:quinone-modifying oxidoreductase subunit QmoC
MQRVNPKFSENLAKFGAVDINACYNCGNCTAICPLSEEGNSFPRKMLRASVLGMEDKIKLSLEPWLCYYCGECSESCPHNANPGELMMSLRRWLTSMYDWTGISQKLYKSFPAHLLVMISIFLLIIGAFILFHGPMTTELTPAGGVKLNSFANWEIIAFLDHILFFILSFFLLSNIFNMYSNIILKDKSIKIPLKLYFTAAWSLIFHFFTQWQFSKCTKKGWYWFSHWLLMSSYVMMFIFIIFLLGWFQTERIYSWWHPQRLLGYYITAGLFFGSIYFIRQRIKKSDEAFKFSHHSDWIFIVLLFLMALTGILIHVFRINGMPLPTYYMYVLHLAFEVPFMFTFVAFSKWSHLAYRPLALYFDYLKKSASKITKK